MLIYFCEIGIDVALQPETEPVEVALLHSKLLPWLGLDVRGERAASGERRPRTRLLRRPSSRLEAAMTSRPDMSEYLRSASLRRWASILYVSSPVCAHALGSEERRVGKGCDRTCRYRWSPVH